ncbi:hypothetical protein T484DRAFT_3069334 [Baffinella frigidus]|nr:hypothetical protein T484DRAFT_3069334 [Cryptophyta sp. CCMP2293]
MSLNAVGEGGDVRARTPPLSLSLSLPLSLALSLSHSVRARVQAVFRSARNRAAGYQLRELLALDRGHAAPSRHAPYRVRCTAGHSTGRQTPRRHAHYVAYAATLPACTEKCTCKSIDYWTTQLTARA